MERWISHRHSHLLEKHSGNRSIEGSLEINEKVNFDFRAPGKGGETEDENEPSNTGWRKSTNRVTSVMLDQCTDSQTGKKNTTIGV